MKYEIDMQKKARMVKDALMLFNESGAHPGEVVLALSEACGRVIASIDGDMVKRELVDIAIKQMAASIEAGSSRIIQ